MARLVVKTNTAPQDKSNYRGENSGDIRGKPAVRRSSPGVL